MRCTWTKLGYTLTLLPVVINLLRFYSLAAFCMWYDILYCISIHVVSIPCMEIITESDVLVVLIMYALQLFSIQLAYRLYSRPLLGHTTDTHPLKLKYLLPFPMLWLITNSK